MEATHGNKNKKKRKEEEEERLFSEHIFDSLLLNVIPLGIFRGTSFSPLIRLFDISLERRRLIGDILFPPKTTRDFV